MTHSSKVLLSTNNSPGADGFCRHLIQALGEGHMALVFLLSLTFAAIAFFMGRRLPRWVRYAVTAVIFALPIAAALALLAVVGDAPQPSATTAQSPAT